MRSFILLLFTAVFGVTTSAQAEPTSQIALVERKVVIVTAATSFEAIAKALQQNPGWIGVLARPLDSSPNNRLWEVTIQR